MTRKIIAIFAALLLATSLCACTGGNETEDTTSNNINIGGSEDNGNNGNNNNETTENNGGNTENNGGNNGGNTSDTLTFTDLAAKQSVYVLHVNGAVNLRTAPTYDASSVHTSVTNGTELVRVAVSTNGEWSKVEYKDATYYIVTKGLTELADLDAGFVAVDKTLVSKGSLKIRIEPIINDKEAIGFYAKGDEITVVMENTAEGWYKVKFVNVNKDETFGYIKSGKDNFVGNKEETSSESVESTEATENENKEPAEAGK